MRLQHNSDDNGLHAAVKVDMTHKYDSFIVLDALERNQSFKKDHLHHFLSILAWFYDLWRFELPKMDQKWSILGKNIW